MVLRDEVIAALNAVPNSRLDEVTGYNVSWFVYVHIYVYVCTVELPPLHAVSAKPFNSAQFPNTNICIVLMTSNNE